MKRNLLLFFTFLLCGALLTANAQDKRRTADVSVAPGTIVKMENPTDVLFSDSFESGDLTKWHQFIQGPGTPGETGNIPYFNVVNEEDVPEDAVQGVYLLQADWGYDISTWIISPEVTVGDNSWVSFYFNSSYYWHVTEDGGSLYVKVSEDGGTTWDILWDWQDIGVWTSWTWYRALVSLEDYAGKDVHIAFHLEANDNSAASLDFVQIFNGEPLSDEAEILEFSFVELPDAVVVIDEFDITVTVAAGTDITALTPTITVSLGATIADFSPTVTIDFTNPVNFVVTSESGYFVNTYTVTVDIETSVEIPATISDLRVFPNPFSHSINIENAENVSRITVVNLIGQVVMDMPYRGETHITTSQLEKGMYLVVFHTNKGDRVVRRMIKQ